MATHLLTNHARAPRPARPHPITATPAPPPRPRRRRLAAARAARRRVVHRCLFARRRARRRPVPPPARTPRGKGGPAPSKAPHQPAFWASRAHASPTQGRAPLESFAGTRSRPPLAPKCRLSLFQTPCRFEASLPGCLAPFPQLSALVARVKARPRIAAYLTSDRYARTDKFGPL